MKNRVSYIILIITFYSCDNANPRTIKAWITSSDTLVQNRIIKEQTKLDSLCTAKAETYYKIAYDSIYAKRWTEMKILLDSIKAE